MGEMMKDGGVCGGIAAPEWEEHSGGEVGVTVAGREGEDVDMRLGRGCFEAVAA